MMVRITGVVTLVCMLVLGLAGTAAADGHLGQLSATLLGANEVGDAGDPDGSGSASVSLNTETNEVCFEISVTNVDGVAAAHIHVGGAGTNGGVVVNFDYDANGSSGCVASDTATVASIMLNPSLYYVNVHSGDFPAGAVRGQLAPAAAGAPAPAPAPTELAFTGTSLTAIFGIAGAALVVSGVALVRVAPRGRRDESRF